MGDITQAQHLISLDTPLGKDKLILTSIEGTEAVSSLFSFALSAFSSDLAIIEKSIVGLPVTCQIKDGEKSFRFINGYVRQFTRKETWVTQVREYRLEIVPWLWFLTLTQDCQVFQNKTVIEICEAIFKQFGFADYEVSVASTYAKREYCVQYNESAFHFISRLLEEEGIFYYFKHEKGKHTLVMCDLVSKCSNNPHADASFSQGSVIPNHITQWEHSYTYCSGEFVQTDYDFIKPTIDLLTTTKTTVDLPNIKNYSVFNFPGLYIDKARGSQLSRVHMEEHEQQHDVIIGASNLCQFCPGTTFNFVSTELAAEKGGYWLTSVTHVVKDETHMLFAQERNTTVYTNEFVCMPTSIPYRPLSRTLKPRIQGLQIAIVTGASQEEIHTDQYGRIKVQFLWDRQGKKNDTSSCWLRVAQTWAGQKWGAQYIPRVGQEVLVDFLNGDPDMPVVVGSLYNAQNMPPYDLPDNQTQSGIKSRSTPKGEATDSNEIRFEDKKGNEQFFMHAQKDLLRVVENDDALQVLGKQDISIKKDRTRTIEEGNEAVQIKKGNQTITIDSGNQTVQVSQGNREAKINMGNDTVHLQQGNYSLKLDVGKSSIEAMQEITLTVGGNSLKIDQTGITIQGLMVKINGKMIQCQADAMMQVKGALVMIN
jgi:type VI secretion system secreted protein VgrG